MPFGKYEGRLIDDIPDNYLLWLWENVDLQGPLLDAVARRIPNIRETLQGPVSPNAINSVYRQLAVKWHPDKGGSKSAMQAINEFYEELKNVM